MRTITDQAVAAEMLEMLSGFERAYSMGLVKDKADIRWWALEVRALLARIEGQP